VTPELSQSSRLVTSKAFAMPGMEEFDRADLPKATRWELDGT
jgi:hypothetical protein